MILSFHPNIVADKNLLCAGRLPDDADRTAIEQADAVILPQGPSEALYRMCCQHCRHVFPNYNARFDFPGKVGQARLFKETQSSFPATYTFDSVSAFRQRFRRGNPLGFPCVCKSDWGGEGEGVFLLETVQALEEHLQRFERFEKGGQKGFLLQEFVPHGGRSLRVVVIGHILRSYWRIQSSGSEFQTGLRSGAVIDHESDPKIQQEGRDAAATLCGKTGINLAGFDIVVPSEQKKSSPVFLEINYYFGRRGLGGSMRYYELVDQAVNQWLADLGLGL
jgi:ribosomal protein S6--L-glutamate ligase